MTVSPEDPVRLDVENPWPGLAPYDETSSGFFYGRREEAEELLRLVRLAPLTVVYGKSGLGKTSLLQAGLFPLLRLAHCLPVHLRLDFSDPVQGQPLEQVMRRLQEELERAKAEHSDPQDGESLWEYLHRKDLEAWSHDNFPLTPVLVFDQFEELFSRSGGNLDLITQVFDGLADLIENRIPADIASATAGPRRSRLDLSSQRYRIVLSFREDFLPEVRTWETKVPSLLRNYLRLDPMSRARAIEAVESAGRAVLSEGVAPIVVDFVGRLDEAADADTSGMVIEPVLLSLCCYQLNRRRAPGSQIDKALVLAAGQDILDSFYREALADPEVKGPPDVAPFIEDYLIQGDHYRGDYPAEGALGEHRITTRQLAALTDRHRLLRIVHHTDTTRIELIHDRLVPVVRKARDERRIKQHQEEQERLALEAQAERDRERARSAELQRQRDKVARSLRIASFSRNVAATLAVVSLVVIGWGWRQRKERDQLKLSAAVGVDTARLAQGRLALGVGMEPLEQTMYRGLAAYRLSASGDQGLSQARAASLTALHFVLDASGHLRKAVTIPGFVPTPALAYSPDGKTLAVGGEDGVIRLLDAESYRETGGQLDCRQTSAEPVWSLSFNGDGTRLAAGYAKYNVLEPGDGLVCVFDVRQHSVLRSWSTRAEWRRPSAVYGVAYSVKPGTDFVIFGGSDETLRLLDVKDGRVRELPQDGAVHSVAVSADGLLVASGSDDAIIRVWNLGDLDHPDAKPLMLAGHGSTINQITFSPADPSMLVSASDDGRLIVWNVTGGADKRGCREQQSHLQSARIYGFAVSPEGDMLAAAGSDGNVRLFRLLKVDTPCSSPKIRGSQAALAEPPEFDLIEDGLLSGHGGLVLAAAYNPKGHHLASAGQDGSIRIWVPKTGGFSLAEFAVQSGVTALAISPDGNFIAAGDEKGDIRLWDRPKEGLEPGTPSAVASWSAHRKGVLSLAYVPIGNRVVLVSGGGDGIVKRWDPAARTTAGPDMEDHADAVRSVAVSPDGKTVAAGSVSGTIRIWNAASGALERKFEKPKDAVAGYELFAVGFTEDGKHLAVGSFDPRLRILDLAGPGSEHMLEGHSNSIKALSHGRDRWVLSAGQDGSVLEWEQDSLAGTQSKSLKKRDDFRFRMGFRDVQPLRSIDTSADGALILTGGENGQIQLWDGIEHVLIGARFPGHKGDSDIQSVALARDGGFFVTADATKILVWPGPKRWADIICSKLVWNMSRAQWAEWISPAIPYRAQCEGLDVSGDATSGKR